MAIHKELKRLPSAEALYAMVAAAQCDARVRLLSGQDVHTTRKVFLAWCRYCNHNGLSAPHVKVHGGAVANAYRYFGDTTELHIACASALDGTRTHVCEASRVLAPKRPGGAGPRIVLGCKTPPTSPMEEPLPTFAYVNTRYTVNRLGYCYLNILS